MHKGQLTTERTLRQIAPTTAAEELVKKDNLRYAVVPIEWLRAVQPIDPRDRPSVRAIPSDMIAALEQLLSVAKSEKPLSLDEELVLRAAAWPTPAIF